MLGSLILYAGAVICVVGLALTAHPIARLGISTRASALVVVGIGAALVVIAFMLPASESRVDRVQSHLDEFVPRWQFSERHTLHVDAPAPAVYDAMRRVKADEIFLFKTLTWIRRGGRRQPENILNAGDREPLMDIALKNGFVALADDPPRELLVGTIVVAPPGARVGGGGTLAPQLFRGPVAPGFALAAMNFVITPEGPKASIVSTETRVFATSPEARRRFAAYWRTIYPGSAIIRRMWLRAIRKRAMSSRQPAR
jgi:hypothetical protein